MRIILNYFASVIFFSLTIAGCSPQPDSQISSANDSSIKSHLPEDGKLSEKLVTDYIKIRQKIINDVQQQKKVKSLTPAEKLEKPNQTIESLYFDEIEQAAARSFNMSYEKYLWIKDTVITTQTSLLVQQYYDLNNKIMVLLDKTLDRFNEIKTNNTDQKEQQVMGGYVDEMKQEIKNLQDKMVDPQHRTEKEQHNILLITKYQKELESLEEQVLQPITGSLR